MSTTSVGEEEEDGHLVSLQESAASDLFDLTHKFGLRKLSEIELYTKYSIGRCNFFAFVVKQTGYLLLVSGYSSLAQVVPDQENVTKVPNSFDNWRLKNIQWFEDPSKRISALSFDEEGLLYIGTDDGTLFELNVMMIFDFEGEIEPDLKQTFHLEECKIVDILIWFRHTTKMLMCNGGNGKLVFIFTNALPILVTFNSAITTMNLFISNAGLSSLLVCLENNQNVTTVLDDLDVPPQEESVVKKSIFKRAKENIISRFGDADKGLIFGKRTSRDIGSGQDVAVASSENVSMPSANGSQSLGSMNNPLTKSSSSVNVKFTTLEDLSSRGCMYKIAGRNQFYRHIATKLDLFEADFRQIASMSLPENISKLFVIEKTFYGVDVENRCVRLSVVHNQMLKEFAIIPFSSTVISIEPAGEMGNMDQFSVFIISQTGVFLVALKKSPLDTCADLLIRETPGSLFDVVCTALSVAKNEVYILAGDRSAEEGKFAKTILYYKVAGMTYSKIVAKFGSRRMIPAMLCFYDLVDNEKTRFTGSVIERNVMGDIILHGRIEQYLRHGAKADPAKDPKTLLLNFLKNNDYYASSTAAICLTYPELFWAAKVLIDIRMCFAEIFYGLYSHNDSFNVEDRKNTLFCELLTCDWKMIYSAPSQIFCWFRNLLLENIENLDYNTLCRVLRSLMPWRRELLRKFFCEVSDLTEIIDFTATQGTIKLVNEDYVNPFIHVFLEILRRKEPAKLNLPTFFYKWQAKKTRQKEMKIVSEIPIASSLFAMNTTKSFSASSAHCVCIRNGRLYSWGDNKLGRLGVRLNRDKFPSSIEIPMPVNLAPSLRLVIDSVSCGQTHTVALTSAGTILGFGSNKYGQLGVGRNCLFSDCPVFPILPKVTFIAVAAGSYHTVAVDHLNRPWTWGWGIFGQLGNNGIENRYVPARIHVDEKIVMASAGHSHTALLTITGKALTFGCAHFGQLGHGLPNVKVKIPKEVAFPVGVVVKSVECGLCSTKWCESSLLPFNSNIFTAVEIVKSLVLLTELTSQKMQLKFRGSNPRTTVSSWETIFLTMRNRIFYAGINPSSIRTMLAGARRRAAEGKTNQPVVLTEEEKDFASPILIDTSHLAGEVEKVNVATTHFAVLTTTGLVYTWGLGKNGQLMRADDESKGLGLIDSEERVLVTSNVICAGECSWIVEKESGRIFGFGFNSAGQLGKIESELESSILTIKTKKRVLRVRQPANVHYKGKEILGLPRKSSVAEMENSIIPQIEISPPTDVVGNELLKWVLNTFYKSYSSRQVAAICAKYENHEAAATVYALEKDYEGVLEHQLAKGDGREGEAIAEYMDTKERDTNCFQETYRFVDIVVAYWIGRGLSGGELETILMPYYRRFSWNSFISRSVKEMISETNDRSKWIARSFTPSFILACIKDSKNTGVSENYGESTNVGKQGTLGYGKPSQNGVSHPVVMDNGGDAMC